MSEAVKFLITAAELLAALSALVGVIVGVYKIIDNNKRQNAVIESMQEEQTVLCYAVQGCLQGLIEQGCDGPCKKALDLLNEHLNKKAHAPNL